jgi:Tfp pilus assembly protein PilX
MLKANTKEKGVVLAIVLSTIFIVIILANILMTIISSQSRLTHHKVSRIQAYYAGQAAMNYAFEQIRTGLWPIPPDTSGTYTLCNSGCTVNDTDIPFPVSINISVPDANGIRTVSLTSTYTYTE